MQSMVLEVGMAVVVAVVAGVALAPGPGAAGKALMHQACSSPAVWHSSDASSTPTLSWVLYGPTWLWASSAYEGHGRAGTGAGLSRQVLSLP